MKAAVLAVLLASAAQGAVWKGTLCVDGRPKCARVVVKGGGDEAQMAGRFRCTGRCPAGGAGKMLATRILGTLYVTLHRGHRSCGIAADEAQEPNFVGALLCDAGDTGALDLRRIR